MQTLNRYVGGRQAVGHIDLLDTISYFEVPEKDARKVMTQLTGIRYKGRTVRCNAEDEGDKRNGSNGRDGHNRSNGHDGAAKSKKSADKATYKKDDWRSLMKNANRVDFKGEEPDFREEGWARRRPKKK